MSETTQEMRVRLPAAVYNLALRLGVKPEDRQPSVKLTQTGRIKRSLDSQSWMAFTATQTISMRNCEFDWRAKVGPLGVISVRDAYQDGAGALSVKGFGIIPIVRAASSVALTRGELMRYLAEIAMAPDAILGNAALRWREVSPDTLTVSAGTGENTAEVSISLDNDGRITGCFAPDRPRSTTAPFLPTPWRGRFSDYRQHDGRWLPFAGEVAWEIDGKELPYFRCRIEDWEALADIA